MKTLIVVAHPDAADSSTQQFLKASARLPDVAWYELSDDWQADIAGEQTRLLAYERIIWQFPLYWYSSPANLKEWLDSVFTDDFPDRLKGRELGLVVTLGVSAKSFQAGGREQFTLSELLRPFQALANRCGMTFLPIFAIHQFMYMTEVMKQKLLIAYQQYLTMPVNASFQETEAWFADRLQALTEKEPNEDRKRIMSAVLAELTENRSRLDDLLLVLTEVKDG
ncbi:NAD(P)H-dependent oxidoreductase [Vagococcus acidifermentans]|uniref:Flavodoxin-like fold domain-containing protein n=1 Tax=Vagococcus acidifermentans TaxID=564710 RepID=A0A430B0I5_9ENTE|nr:NAD(P)H-dependent oxidoreductase [Vagococcus acidifermentans]RSU13806.1 hypothetical protein CBF27_02595 [Vagococcus acidifermentans]